VFVFYLAKSSKDTNFYPETPGFYPFIAHLLCKLQNYNMMKKG